LDAQLRTRPAPDSYTVVMRQSKLPMSLLKDPDKAQKVNLLDTQPFATTFGKKAQRKRPKLSIGSMTEMVAEAEEREAGYDPAKDRDIVVEYVVFGPYISPVCPSMCLFACVFTCPPVYAPGCPSICLSVCPSVT